MRKILWLAISGMMVLSLVMAACGKGSPETPAQSAAPVPQTVAPAGPQEQAQVVEEKVQTPAVLDQKGGAIPIVALATDAPKYGGTLWLSTSSDTIPRSDTTLHTVGSIFIDGTNEELLGGDWTLGPAGGWGSNVANWASNPDRWDYRTGVLAESAKWSVDLEKQTGTIVYQIREGVHWALDPKSEASKLVNGREFTADDAIFHMKRMITEKTAYLYLQQSDLRVAEITKTGPSEVSVKVPIGSMISAISRFGDSIQFEAPEVIQKYGTQASWKEMVGTGPYMVTDFVPGAMIIKRKNPNHWDKDPIGPGKGNQLPYIDTIKTLILPDASTRQAAFRTAKIDASGEGTIEEIAQMKERQPYLVGFGEGGLGTGVPFVSFRTDRPPFNDIRVRQALHMGIDWEGLNKIIYLGKGYYPMRPFEYDASYKELYLGLNDPDMPPEVKELWSYNPGKAKQLLKEAGYPNGFKTSVMISSTAVDSWSIYKDLWAKIGVELVLDLRDSGALTTLYRNKSYDAMVPSSGNFASIWYSMPAYTGTGDTNRSMVNDPLINETLEKARLVALTEGEVAAFKMLRELSKHIYWQVYDISPINSGRSRTIYWWPWLKNYNGELYVGYFNNYWWKWSWIDQDLKKKMGY